jgi:ADP-heptose:LPS heptosyltransferase
MTCLVIKNDGVGDLVLASGLIAALGRHFKGKVDLVTCSANREVAMGIEPLRERYFVSRDALYFSTRAWNWGLLWPRMTQEDAAVLRTLRAQHYDYAICLRRFIRQNSLVIMRFVRADRKLCMWQMPTNASVAMASAASAGWSHYQGPMETLSELSYALGALESEFGWTLDARPRLSFCQRQTKMPATKRVALGLSGSSTNWPYGNWIELAMLLSERGWKLSLYGDADMQELSDQIAGKVSGVNSLVGRLSWKETASSLQICDAYIGNDTGLSHIASLVNLKCLIILGGGTFRRFFPWPSADNQTVIFHGLPCFDCDWQCSFKERYCLSLIRPCDVMTAFIQMMDHGDNSSTLINLGNTDVGYHLAWRRQGVGNPAHFPAQKAPQSCRIE